MPAARLLIVERTDFILVSVTDMQRSKRLSEETLALRPVDERGLRRKAGAA